MKKRVFIFVLMLIFCFTGVMVTQSSDETTLTAPKTMVVLKSHMKTTALLTLVVVDLTNDELVILHYKIYPYEGEKHLDVVIRTGMTVDVRLQKQIGVNESL